MKDRTPTVTPVSLESWNRREAFTFFGGMSCPFYSISYRQDVTAIKKYCKENHLSFYFTTVWLFTKAINETEAFLYATNGNQPYRYSHRTPSLTVLQQGSECFTIVTPPMCDDVREFCSTVACMAERSVFLDPTTESDNLIYFSCVPWLDITSLTGGRDLAAPNARDDSVPRITWGKYVAEGEKLVMTVSVEVNHRFIDGYHIGKLAETFGKLANDLA